MYVCVILSRHWRWGSVADCVDFMSFIGWSLVGQSVSTTQYGGCLACSSSECPGGAEYKSNTGTAVQVYLGKRPVDFGTEFRAKEND